MDVAGVEDEWARTASLRGEYVDSDQVEMIGGLAAPTRWPLASGMAIDMFYDRSTDPKVGLYPAGFYRGIIDRATRPSKTGLQKLTVDFDDLTRDKDIVLREKDLVEPGTVQVQDINDDDGEVAQIVRPEDIVGTQDAVNPWGLTDEQESVLKDLWYTRGHYSSAGKLWELLRREAEAQGAEPFFGIRLRQARSWVKSQEAKQLFKIPRKVREFRSFDLPSTPLRTVMIDTADLGAVGGLADSKQKYIISMIDPASRWAHSEIFGTKAPRAQDARQVIRDGLLELRSGPLAYKATNKENVFDANGHLTKVLTVMSDNGGEFKSTTDESWEDKLYSLLAATGLVSDRALIKHRRGLANTPTQQAFIERYNSSLRQKLRLAVQAEQGLITRQNAKNNRKQSGWKALIKRAVDAFNTEVSSGTGMTPLEYLKRHVTEGKQARVNSTGTDKQTAEKVEAQLEREKEIKAGMYVRLVSLAREKASLLGSKKMMPRFSEEIFIVDKVNKHTRRATGNVTYTYKLRRSNGQEKDGNYKREQLQIIPELSDKWYGPAIKGKSEELARAGTIPKVIPPTRRGGKWKQVRDGSSWAEKQIDRIPKDQRGGLK
eukprot:COSAG02_NODE_9962_length_2063_cov_10.244681_1_plen_601_part_01